MLVVLFCRVRPNLTRRTIGREADAKPFQCLSNVICMVQIPCRGVFYMS
jgi:hypothetical protein